MAKEQTIEPRRRKSIRLAEVARTAEISISTASMALADHPRIGLVTKRRVREVVKQLGYRRPCDVPAPRARGSRGSLVQRIGFVVVGGAISDESNTEVLEGLSAAASTSDFRLELASVESDDPHERERRTVDFAQSVDGLLILGLIDHPMLVALGQEKAPFVVLGHVLTRPSEMPDEGAHTVTTDEVDAGRLATNRLLACGHRRIAFIAEWLPVGLCHDRWLAGYRLAHVESGLIPDSSLLHVSGQPLRGARAAADAFLGAANPPTAYLIPDARIAASFLDAMRVRGREISPSAIVIGASPATIRNHGVDSYPHMAINPKLMAKVALDQLLRLCQDRDQTPVQIKIPFMAYHLPEVGKPAVSE
jgi:LacI family repressor for deo operon, udp, cdd, tsx, nupC, and nupG